MVVTEIKDENLWHKIKSRRRQIIPAVFILILITAIGSTLWLLQKPQDVRQRADFASTGEFGSTPSTQFENYPRSVNGIQLMTFLIFNNETMTTNVRKYLGKQMDYLWLDQGSYLAGAPPSYDFSQYYNFIDSFNVEYPRVKIGIHAGAIGSYGDFHPISTALSEIDYLHDNSNNLLHFEPDTRMRYINVSSETVRSKIATGWNQIITAHPAISGLLFDSYYPYDRQTPLINGCREGACNTESFWESGITTLTSQIKQANSTKEMYFNGLYYDLSTINRKADLNNRFIDRTDGVLAEWPHEILLSPDVFEKYMQAISSDTALGKKVLFWVQPQIFNGDPKYVGYINNLELQRFFLASYLLIQNNPHTFFGYHPGEIYRSTNVYFYKDWNLNYGQPTSAFQKLANGLFVREYQNGISVVNPTNQDVQYIFPNDRTYKAWDITSSVLIKNTALIGRKSGLFFFYVDASQNQLIPSGQIGSGITTFSWPVVAGTKHYLLRIDDTSNPWSGKCDTVGENPGDVCIRINTNNYKFTTVPDHSYHWWIHDVNSSDVTSPPLWTDVIARTIGTTTITTSPIPSQTTLTTTTPIQQIPTNTPSPTPTRTPTPTPTPTPGITPNGITTAGIKKITWPKVIGATQYLLRVDDTSNPWTGKCVGGANNPGDICTSVTSNSYNYSFVSKHNYQVWVHAVVGNVIKPPVSATIQIP